MKYSNYNDLLNNIEYNKIYFVYGKDIIIINKFIDVLINKFSDKNNMCFNVHEFEGDKINIKDLENSLEILPLMSNKKIVIIKNLDINKISSTDYDKLKELIQELSDKFILLFIYKTEINISSSKYKSFLKLIDKNGVIFNSDFKDKDSIIDYMIKYAKKNDCIISRDLCEFIIDKSSLDISLITLELDKICNFTFNGKIDFEKVKELLSDNTENNSFELANSILMGDINSSLIILNNLFNKKIDPLMVLGSLNMSFIDLYISKVARENGFSYNKILDNFNYKGKDFRVKKSYINCVNFSKLYLINCIDILMDIDLKLKTCKLDSKILLEKSIIKMVNCR